MIALTTGALAITLVLGFAAVAARDFLVSILSLSGGSVALAVYFFLAGAPIAAVFEAVVAAGLITVLFLFVISLTETDTAQRVHPAKRTVVGLALGGLLGVGIVVWALLDPAAGEATTVTTFAQELWSGRSIDVLAVTILMFVGVLAVVRLTAEHLDPATDTGEDQPGATAPPEGDT
ncbi:NADH-quinone oxidoreductase subunit J [Halorhabdus sp. CBA1104]|uniref:NADH-quinone oxidoreductase subunit J n=1 Tax=Halorhabdus sp. CBA1104 TaxID=1380432 RepID=UPI0012B3524C|nr:NADH-quinone oxidoreductase subunit J [Halorhabdus sp. CBA1104]QGN06326.1 NADH-quinone oxidoreductase subunit J [Halorhabdus sp. CBA1104]